MSLREELRGINKDEAIVAAQNTIDRLHRGEAEQATMDHVLDRDYEALSAAVVHLYEAALATGVDDIEAAFIAIGARSILHIQRELAERQLFRAEDLPEFNGGC